MMSQTLHIAVPEKVFATLERTAKTTRQPLEDIAAEWLERVAAAQDDPLDADRFFLQRRERLV
jgi:hypothetical protein